MSRAGDVARQLVRWWEAYKRALAVWREPDPTERWVGRVASLPDVRGYGRDKHEAFVATLVRLQSALYNRQVAGIELPEDTTVLLEPDGGWN